MLVLYKLATGSWEEGAQCVPVCSTDLDAVPNRQASSAAFLGWEIVARMTTNTITLTP